MIHRIKSLFQTEAVSYLFWGGAATVVNWIVYTAMSFLTPCSMMVCNLAAWLAAVLFAYLTNRCFVFRSRANRPPEIFREFFLFLGARIFTGLFEIFLPSLLFRLGVTSALFGIEGFWAKAIVTILIILMNYILSKRIVFRKASEKHSET